MHKSLSLVAIAISALAATASASAATLEERVQQLEKSLASLAQENAALKKQLGADAKSAPAVVVAQGKETKLALGGFFHLNAEAGDPADSRFPDNDRFLLRKVRLGVKGSFGSDVDFVIQGDFGANTLSSTSAYRVQATDAYALWKTYPAFNVTFGQFKTPFGYEQLLSDTKTPTVERTLASDSLTLSRQAGLMASGNLGDPKFTYAAALTNGVSANTSSNDNEQFTAIGRLAATLYSEKDVKISVGADGYRSRDTGTFIGHRTGLGVDAQVSAGPAAFAAEWLQAHYDRDTGADYDATGWSIIGTYFVLPNRLQLVARYETYDPTDLTSGNDYSTTTLGFNYLFKGDDLKLSLNYLLGNPPGTAGHQDRLLARLQLVF